MKAAELVGDFISTLNYDDIPSSVVLEAKRALLDCIGVSIAAIGEPCLAILKGLVQRMGGHPCSALLGTNIRTSPSWAALYNGTMAHALDFDDGAGLHIPLHPSVPVLPAMIALGEFVGASGKRVLEAFIAGTEVECKFARGCTRESYDLGWHATGVFGTMGAAAGAAKLLGLDRGRVIHALAVALSLAGGSRQNFGTMVKPLHAGVAAMNGVLSAMLAQDGYVGSEGALDGPAGFSKLFGGKNLIEECNLLGRPFHLENGFSIKKYPSCYATHTAIDAILDLLDKHQVDYRDVQAITCQLAPAQVSGLPYMLAKTPLEGKFSIPFLLALACVYRSVELKHFNEALVKDTKIIDLSKRVRLIADNDLTFLRSRVTIELTQNRHYSTTVDKPRGHPEHPLRMDEVQNKFRSCAGILLPENEAEWVLRMILDMEELENIGSLTAALQGGSQ